MFPAVTPTESMYDVQAPQGSPELPQESSSQPATISALDSKTNTFVSYIDKQVLTDIEVSAVAVNAYTTSGELLE